MIKTRKLFFLISVVAITFFVLAPRASEAVTCCICRNPLNQRVVSCPELPAGEACRIYEQYPQNLQCGNPIENCETKPECSQWYQTGRGKPEGVPGTAPGEVLEQQPYQPTPIKVPTLGISIPGLTFTSEESKIKICTKCKDAAVDDPAECPAEKCTSWAYQIPWIGEYISAFYKWAVGALAVLAVIMIMISGIRWLIAGGAPEKISSAKQSLVAAIFGLIFILIVNQVLAMINPELTILKPIVIGVIERIEIPSQENIGITEAPPPGEPIPPGTNNIPLFKQGDSQWATHPFGICGTVRSSGCGPTSLAMVLKYYGQNINPPMIADQVVESGFRICDQPPGPKCEKCYGTAHAAFHGNNSIPKKIYKFTTAQSLGRREAAKNNVLNLLRQGKPVIAAMGKSIFTQHGHFIVLTGLDASGNILVNDPNRNISQATQDQVFCCLSAAFYITP